MADTTTMAGGCMCGSVRYLTVGTPVMITHCHCLSCRKHNGAVVATLALFKADQVTFTGIDRKRYNSSGSVHRAFCGECGTPLTWEGDAGGDLGPIFEIHLSTFDDPNALVPTAHAFYSERISWFDIADKLPRFEGAAGQTPPLRHGPEPGLN
ncbi:MAG: GFA family protein [Pseudomonadales bacterium]